MSDLEHAMQNRTLHYRWEKAKLDMSEWWLRVVMRRPGALEDEDD